MKKKYVYIIALVLVLLNLLFVLYDKQNTFLTITTNIFMMILLVIDISKER